MVSPSRRMTTCTGPAGTPLILDAEGDGLLLPTMPKRGADTSTTRRSRSSARPVTRACSGAAKPSSARVRRNVVHTSVGDNDRAGDAVGRHVGESGSRSSRVKDGLASASSRQASAMLRTMAPRLRASSSKTATRIAMPAPAHST
jgi:hypothetical protein